LSKAFAFWLYLLQALPHYHWQHFCRRGQSMPLLSQAEIAHRARLIAQELRLVQGGEALKKLLQVEIRDLHKAQFNAHPPPAENVSKIMSVLIAQLDAVEDTAWAQTLAEYHLCATQWLQTCGETPLPATAQAPTHLTLPLIPHWCRNEHEICFEIAAILSDLRDDYQPQVLLRLFFESLRHFEDKHGSTAGFVDQIDHCCQQHPKLLTTILTVFESAALLDLSTTLSARHTKLTAKETKRFSPQYISAFVDLVHKFAPWTKKPATKSQRCANQAALDAIFQGNQASPPTTIAPPLTQKTSPANHSPSFQIK
jgi:hypothetical protein